MTRSRARREGRLLAVAAWTTRSLAAPLRRVLRPEARRRCPSRPWRSVSTGADDLAACARPRARASGRRRRAGAAASSTGAPRSHVAQLLRRLAARDAAARPCRRQAWASACGAGGGTGGGRPVPCVASWAAAERRERGQPERRRWRVRAASSRTTTGWGTPVPPRSRAEAGARPEEQRAEHQRSGHDRDHPPVVGLGRVGDGVVDGVHRDRREERAGLLVDDAEEEAQDRERGQDLERIRSTV